jgi:hypothetical protein
MKGAVAWFADNHVAANLLMIFLLLAGAVTGLTTKSTDDLSFAGRCGNRADHQA